MGKTTFSEVLVGGNVSLGGSSVPGFVHRVEDSAEDLSGSAEDRLVQGNEYSGGGGVEVGREQGLPVQTVAVEGSPDSQ